jgi:hypothetical protein
MIPKRIKFAYGVHQGSAKTKISLFGSAGHVHLADKFIDETLNLSMLNVLNIDRVSETLKSIFGSAGHVHQAD